MLVLPLKRSDRIFLVDRRRGVCVAVLRGHHRNNPGSRCAIHATGSIEIWRESRITPEQLARFERDLEAA